MRERLDCVILGFDDLSDWPDQGTSVHARGRLHIHRLDFPGVTVDDVHVLAALTAILQRYDACVLNICEKNLAWVRCTLFAAHGQVRTPIIGLVHNLKAPAISDLYNLGMADFVRAPICTEELRVRMDRLLNMSRVNAKASYADTAIKPLPTVDDGQIRYGRADVCSDVDGNDAGVPGNEHERASDQSVVREPGDSELEAFARASASRCTSSSDSFAVAKSKVVGCFERAYLCASLAKSSGNITLAAREAKKHRRAFWALLRKHDIDAALFRKG